LLVGARHGAAYDGIDSSDRVFGPRCRRAFFFALPFFPRALPLPGTPRADLLSG